MNKTPKHESTYALSLIMFYNNRNSLVFKVLGVVVYLFNDKYVRVNYLCLQRELKKIKPQKI